MASARMRMLWSRLRISTGEHVQFELAAHACGGDRHVVAKHLRAHHGEGLALSLDM
jgi:hypothetical protein